MEIEKKANPGGDGWVTGLVETHLRKVASSSANYKRKHTIRPSEMGGCTRAIVYDILNFPSDDIIEPKLKRIFDNGHAVHERYLEKYFPKLNIICKVWKTIHGKKKYVDFSEVTIRDEDLWLVGKPDAIIFHPVTGERYVFELKSINQESFWKLEEPESSHIYQAHIYMYMTNLTKAILFYEDKNKQNIKEFEVKFDRNIMYTIIQKIRVIQRYVNEYSMTNALPEREYDKKGCKYCPFSTKPTGCLSDWKKKKKRKK